MWTLCGRKDNVDDRYMLIVRAESMKCVEEVYEKHSQVIYVMY